MITVGFLDKWFQAAVYMELVGNESVVYSAFCARN